VAAVQRKYVLHLSPDGIHATGREGRMRGAVRGLPGNLAVASERELCSHWR